MERERPGIGVKRNDLRRFAVLFVVIVAFLFSATGCDKKCEVKVLDWPDSIKNCITEEEEKGLRDGTKKPKDVWDALRRRCPKVEADDNGSSLYDLAANKNAILVGNKQELVEKLTEYTKKHKCCIKKIIFMGHGAPGKISVGDGQRTVECKHINGYVGNEDDWKRDLAGLKKILCKDATFVLEGCSVGFCSVGLFKMQELAKEFGVTVIAPIVNMTAGTHVEDLEEEEKRKVTPPIIEEAKPKKECEDEFYKIKEKETEDKMETGIYRPFAGKIDALAFYPATYEEIPDIRQEPYLPIVDLGWIDVFEKQIDSTRAYNATGQTHESDAVIVIRYVDGNYNYAYTTYGHRIYGRINDDGIDRMFKLSEAGRTMLQEGIELTLRSLF